MTRNPQGSYGAFTTREGETHHVYPPMGALYRSSWVSGARAGFARSWRADMAQAAAADRKVGR